MKKRTTLTTLSAVLVAGVALAGCGQSATTGSTPDSSGGDTGAKGGKILIATQSPLSGAQSNFGDSLKTGVEFALSKKEEAFKALGFDLQLSPQDDQADPKQGVANAELLLSNPDVLGVVGHLNTGVSIPASVKYEEAGLVMVTPSNTGVKLTEEGKEVVNRICARDDSQGPKAASYAKNTLGVKKAFLIHDKTAYGQGLAEEVKKQFEKDGVEVLGFEGITQGEKDFSAVLNQAVAANPDMIYLGAIYSDGGILVKQAREKGFKGAIMGGDGLDSTDMYKLAGDKVEGVYFTSTAGDVRTTEDGKKRADAYEKEMGKKPELYSVYSYDSANVILEAIEKLIKENGGKKPTREQVAEAVRKTKDFQGQFTKVTFDEKGDNQFADVYIYQYGKDKTNFMGKIE